MSPWILETLREAGRIAAAARDGGARRIVAGASLREVCESVEAEILRRGAGIAFPVQSSRNHVAAHYCPSPEDETVYAEGDVAKLDVGVHLDGYVVDTAVTVNVGDRPENRRVLEAAVASLEAAIDAAGPGVEVRRISAVIAGKVRSFGLNPMRNLCGHGVGRWTVHCPPPIPNVPDDAGHRLALDSVVAIEPFATDGSGIVGEEGPAEVFRLDPRKDDASRADSEVAAAIRAFRGLPFARRQLSTFPRPRVERTLATMRAEGRLTAYAPLVERTGRPVAQAEHTLYLGADGVEVLTR